MGLPFNSISFVLRRQMILIKFLSFSMESISPGLNMCFHHSSSSKGVILKNFIKEYISFKLFMIGVPVRIHLRSASNLYAAILCFADLLQMVCPSSKIMRYHLIVNSPVSDDCPSILYVVITIT